MPTQWCVKVVSMKVTSIVSLLIDYHIEGRQLEKKTALYFKLKLLYQTPKISGLYISFHHITLQLIFRHSRTNTNFRGNPKADSLVSYQSLLRCIQFLCLDHKPDTHQNILYLSIQYPSRVMFLQWAVFD